MLKEKIFKFLFPDKFYEIEFLKEEINEAGYCVCEPEILLPIDFEDIDEEGKPPHYLKGLTDMEQKHFIAHLESIYSDRKFQAVINYVINVIANYSFQKEPDESKMRNGRFAVIGIRTLMKELEKAHSEFINSKKPEEEWDPLDIMPG